MVDVPSAAIKGFQSDGYVVARGLFSGGEAAFYIDHFVRLREADSDTCTNDSLTANLADGDPLKVYPRMIHMHRWDKVSLDWMIDARIGAWLEGLTGQPAFAVQTMLYFKPPGSRGQALHQDQYYLKAKPGTCVAAWMALDTCDEENGCLRIVPGSGDLPLLCTEKADTGESFTDVIVPLPGSLRAEPVILAPGDVLFFNGSVIHGSLPNTSRDRFRRSLIGHYLTGDARQVSKSYKSALDMQGNPVTLEESDGGGPCGVWVEKEGGAEVVVAN